MKRPAWNGSPPRGAEEAKTRIIDAAMRCVDRYGPDKTSLSDVAADLGVIRQTVYRYFPSTEDLFAAVGTVARDGYVDRLVEHVGGMLDPGEVAVEALAYTIEQVPKDPHIGLLLSTGRPEAFSRGAASAEAFEAARAVFSRSDVDWESAGYTGEEFTEMLEFLLRVVLSFVEDPMRPRGGEQLRRFLRRWVMPAVRAGATERS